MTTRRFFADIFDAEDKPYVFDSKYQGQAIAGPYSSLELAVDEADELNGAEDIASVELQVLPAMLIVGDELVHGSTGDENDISHITDIKRLVVGDGQVGYVVECDGLDLPVYLAPGSDVDDTVAVFRKDDTLKSSVCNIA